MSEHADAMVADALRGSWVHRFLPRALWPYAQLARWERPIGWWLLMWPCWWSLMLGLLWLASMSDRAPSEEIPTIWRSLLDSAVHFVNGPGRLLLLFMIGAIAMRGAGCTWNDFADRDIDAKIARTRSRPLPSGRVTRRDAFVFLALQLAVGLVVLLQFNASTIWLGVASLVTIVVYPFMKRITWWPQFFLGLAFSWGALMGWYAIVGYIFPIQDQVQTLQFWREYPLGAAQQLTPFILYLGCICWVIGYDTIYALQDIEDDALVGVKSTARLFGENAKPAIAALYAVAWLLFALAFFLSNVTWPGWIGLALGGVHMAWQVATLDPADPVRCKKLFYSNSHFGWILFAGLVGSVFLYS